MSLGGKRFAPVRSGERKDREDRKGNFELTRK